MASAGAAERSPSALARHGFAGLWVLAAVLPLVGLVSLLLRSQLDPNYDNHKVHFVLFVGIGAVVSVLAYVAGRRPPNAETPACC